MKYDDLTRLHIFSKGSLSSFTFTPAFWAGDAPYVYLHLKKIFWTDALLHWKGWTPLRFWHNSLMIKVQAWNIHSKWVDRFSASTVSRISESMFCSIFLARPGRHTYSGLISRSCSRRVYWHTGAICWPGFAKLRLNSSESIRFIKRQIRTGVLFPHPNP